MKREGKQHGMIRTRLILPPLPTTRPIVMGWIPQTSNPTSGKFSKVQSKPTNHSRFTGKCWSARCPECHLHPYTKSKVKTKGYWKVRSKSNDVTYKMLTWQVAAAAGGSSPDLKVSGFSATGILGLMCDDYEEEDLGSVVEEIVNIQSDDDVDVEKGEDGSQDDDESMSFCDVEMMMDHVGEFDEEGWLLVEEMMT
ncbi:hypothetical protein EUTSA_v10028030mg [Eutrema salsugineum]|uniref:Uncharacterized protein n=1 Tax=Eutrema salsugineum TaxID=72664 RepID=V4M3S0_EUTSA|nr:hypothetical protein EUTSA_v10028030mg [Eutrema salsugineum]